MKFRVEYLGTTDECDVCGCCGNTNLKKTVMLFVLDEDGNRDELVYYGTSCAAKALNMRPSQVTKAADEANRERLRHIDRLRFWLTDLDPMGRHTCEARRLWTRAVRAGVRIDVNGVTYGPNEPDGFKFLGFSAAMENVWEKELRILQDGQGAKGTRPDRGALIRSAW